MQRGERIDRSSSPFCVSAMRNAEMSVILEEGKMKTLKKIGRWVKDLKEDMRENSVSQMKSTSPCCSKPIVTTNKKKS